MRPSARRSFSSGFLALSAIALLAGCPGSLADPSMFEDASTASDAATDAAADVASDGEGAASCPDIPQAVLGPRCATGGCHSAAAKTAGLDLGSPNVFARLAAMPATKDGAIVDPKSPAKSLLYTKLTASPPIGERMPLGGMPLDDRTMGCVLTWISQR